MAPATPRLYRPSDFTKRQLTQWMADRRAPTGVRTKARRDLTVRTRGHLGHRFLCELPVFLAPHQKMTSRYRDESLRCMRDRAGGPTAHHSDCLAHPRHGGRRQRASRSRIRCRSGLIPSRAGRPQNTVRVAKDRRNHKGPTVSEGDDRASDAVEKTS